MNHTFIAAAQQRKTREYCSSTIRFHAATQIGVRIFWQLRSTSITSHLRDPISSQKLMNNFIAGVVIGSRVMNRREFVAKAAGASIFVRAASSFAAQGRYDLVIKGGRVIDPSVRLDGVRDVAISGGRIAAVEANITGSAVETVNAGGKIVAPGLIDIHTHCARDGRGPGMVLKDGVTGWIDAGSQGGDKIAETVAVAKTSPQLGRCLVNVGRAGILTE